MSKTKGFLSKMNMNIIISVGILIFVVVWFASGFLSSNKGNVPNEVKTVGKSKDRSSTVVVQESSLKEIEKMMPLTGSTTADRTGVVVAKVDGNIERVYAVEGKYVKAGRLILKIEERGRKEQYEKARAALKRARLEYNAGEKLLLEELISKAEWSSIEVKYYDAKASYTLAKEAYDNTFVRMPFSGYIDKIEVNQGNYARTGEVLAKVFDVTPYIVESKVSEKDFRFMKEGQKARVSLSDGRLLLGKIERVYQVADDARMYEIRISVPNRKREILPINMSAKIQVSVGTDKAVVIPSSLMTTNDKGDSGFKIVNDDGIVEFVQADLWNSDEKWVSLVPRKKLKNNKIKVIVLGGQAREGDKVLVQNTNSSEATSSKQNLNLGDATDEAK